MKHILPHLVLFTLVCSLFVSCSEEKTGEAAPPPSVIEKPKLTAKVEPEPVKVDTLEVKRIAPQIVTSRSVGYIEPLSYESEPIIVGGIYSAPPRISEPTRELRFPVENEIDQVIDFPDVDPQFPGGLAAMKLFIQETMEYPEKSLEQEDQGRVYVSFIVEKDGSISNIEIPRSLTVELDKEAKRIVRAMPNWIPAKKKGEVVRSRARFPITFTLE